jgi:hypothetical protein
MVLERGKMNLLMDFGESMTYSTEFSSDSSGSGSTISHESSGSFPFEEKSLRVTILSTPTEEGAELDVGSLHSDVVLLKNWLPERARE